MATFNSGAGYAAAVQPVTASAITTDSSGLVADDVEIMSDGFPLPAYRAMPDVGDLFPIVLVVQEIFGLHEYIKDVCRRFAKHGYLAVAVQTFARAGDPSGLSDVADIRPIVNATPDDQTMADLDNAVAWAVQESGGDPARVGITGFCWGGRTVWLYAAYSDDLKAGVAWYGRLAGDSTPNQPTWPIDVAARLKAPVLGLYGGQDPSIPLDVVDKMNGLLQDAGGASRIVVYPHAPHGFHADYRPNFRVEDALDGTRRMYDWFTHHGLK